MKRLLLSLVMMLFCVSYVSAQTMSDEQIIRFAVKERNAGVEPKEIASKLMQRGVTVEQMKRVQKKIQRMQKQQALGTKDDILKGDGEGDKKRLRKNNVDKQRKDLSLSSDSLKRKDRKEVEALVSGEDGEEDLLFGESDEFYEDFMKSKKRIFGHRIFNNENMSFEPAMNIATPADYRIGPGDEIFVDIYGASQKSVETTVAPDGFIVIEGYGPVQVSGMTIEEANRSLRSQLGQRYESSNIRLSVGQTRTITVNVMGEAAKPGTYTLPAFATVFHALYMAGGPNEIGTLRNIKVYRNNRMVTTVDIYDYILNGNLKGNIRLQDDDVVAIGTYDCLVNVTGKVKRPMYYEMKKNESVGTLLSYAGGFTGDAYKKSVRLVRKNSTQYSVFTVKEFDMNTFKVADEDSVSVDSILPRFTNMVKVVGAVFRPGMYELGNGNETVKSLLEHAEGLTEEAFGNHAVMHRMKADRTLEALSVNASDILAGTAPDIPLRNEDVLFIPSKEELNADRIITIHGEVLYPGEYQYADNQTIEDFVLQAGGLKESASMVNVMVSRRVYNPRATESDTIIGETFNFSLKDGFMIDGDQSFTLKPYDHVFVRRSPGFNEQKNVFVEGQVLFTGAYTLTKKNERLSDLVRKAGGCTDIAYIKGARLERKMNDSEIKRFQQTLKIMDEQKENVMIEQALKVGRSINDLQTEESKRRKQEDDRIPEYYSVGIHLDKALQHPGSDYDVILREGDRLIVPVYNGTVKINGEVLYPNSVAFQKGKSAKYYINQAGGYSQKARKRQAYIIYPNGDVAKARKGEVAPGCEIVVPEKVVSKMSTVETIALGTGIASIATALATMANLMK